jgi:hypothetical protein
MRERSEGLSEDATKLSREETGRSSRRYGAELATGRSIASWLAGAQAGGDQLLDLAGAREAAEAALREQQLVAGGDLEDAAAPLDQPGRDAEPLLEIGRQTGGPWLVVSDDAVLDGDLHAAPPSSSLPRVSSRPADPCPGAGGRRG